MSTALPTIAYFVSSHGLGHATRSTAIINEIHASKKDIHFLILSDLSDVFWKKNLDQSVPYTTLRFKTDIGLFQDDAFTCNIPKSVELLKAYLQKPVHKNTSLLKAMGKFDLCHVVCDISPLGIKLANYLGLKTTLIENFTWDWIYQPLIPKCQAFKDISNRLKAIFDTVHLRIQATPYCEKINGAVEVQPVYRNFQASPSEIYRKLNITQSQKLILMAANDLQLNTKFKQFIKNSPHRYILCGDDKNNEINMPTRRIPQDSNFHFPDLIRASAVVIGKIGYGMTVECWAAQTKLIGVTRKDFRESEVLKDFIVNQDIGISLTTEEFKRSSWLHHLEKQIENSPNTKSARVNGNGMASRKIIQIATG